MRTSQVELLHGLSGWVEVKDNGLVYGFDATKVMYSSGNVSERHRISNINADGEVVIDAYAGIGYYCLQLLVHSKVEHVHACEINPNSIEALAWSANKNGVEEKLTIHQQDNRATLRQLAGCADRVLLGYLPSSEATWKPAVEALKPQGGTLHIHMNVEEERIEIGARIRFNNVLIMRSNPAEIGILPHTILRKLSGTHPAFVMSSWMCRFHRAVPLHRRPLHFLIDFV